MRNFRILMVVLATATTTGCYGGRLLTDRLGDTSPSDGPSGTSAVVDAGALSLDEAKQQMMVRWNLTVSANPSDFTKNEGFDFYWPTFAEFPHPTYKGGSDAAYQEFARLLLIFMQSGDNFDFLASNKLFDLRLTYDMASVQGEPDWSLRELVDACSSDNPGAGYIGITSATRNGLKSVKTKIAARN